MDDDTNEVIQHGEARLVSSIVEGPCNIDSNKFQAKFQNTKTVFVTSTTTTGNIQHDGLTGLAAADSICNERASSAGLPGTYMAWLSSGSASARDRLDCTHDDVPFVRVDGVTVANDWADLVDGSLTARINRDENGNHLVGIRRYGLKVWTGTEDDGGSGGGSNRHCSGWTSIGGNGLWVWTNEGLDSEDPEACSGGKRLYCFQQVSVAIKLDGLAQTICLRVLRVHAHGLGSFQIAILLQNVLLGRMSQEANVLQQVMHYWQKFMAPNMLMLQWKLVTMNIFREYNLHLRGIHFRSV